MGRAHWGITRAVELNVQGTIGVQRGVRFRQKRFFGISNLDISKFTEVLSCLETREEIRIQYVCK